MDVWDGTTALLDNYRTQTGVTYPIGMMGHVTGVEAAYDCESSFVFVIDGDGVIIYRGFFVDADVRAAVDAGLAALAPSAVPEAMPGHSLLGAAPNPFNPRTSIRFTLAGDGGVEPALLEILDVRGRVVRLLLNESLPTGRPLAATWDGTDPAGRPVAAGTYFARLKVGDWTATRPLTLLK